MNTDTRMTENAITPEVVAKHNLTPDEYERILKILGRPPGLTELGIFSVMWSEHCSYKNTRPVLKTFPTKGEKILVGAGEENAGIIDVGDGLAIAFKIESHNHPSAVEPFQGAATGVGGIIRDIFTMGARPVAAINSLRFGDLSNPEVRRLFNGVVAGIAHYGNCFGIPTVAGEVYFDTCYEGNPLVNAFCIGVLRHEQITRGAAHGVGNPVFYVGPATGRDGLAGAAFASQDLTDESAEQQRGAVQVGDPFMEKLVCEACLELLATGAVAGMQDMGAAGLTCSTCETAARAGTGIEIELDKVPQRAPNMTSYEIMLSESQERMLIVVTKGREEEVKRIFDKWDLPWSEIGTVTDTGRMVVKHHGEIVADIPARQLTDEAPVYFRESAEPEYREAVKAFRLDGIPDTTEPVSHLTQILASHSVASKNWVYRQYDHMVRDGTIVCPGSDAAVIRIKSDSLPVLPAGHPAQGQPVPEKIVAMTVDCNAGYVYLDPFEGGKTAVAEACRNLACSGARPLGVTDNLNFGNPHNLGIFWQLKESVRGLAEACRAFGIPVTGGNCSLYNQRGALGAIDPTPTVAVVGIVDSLEHVTTQWFKDEGDAIILLGLPVDTEDPLQGLGGSSYLKTIHRTKSGLPPRCDLSAASTLHTTLLGLIQEGVIKSAHDCSEGGLAVALAEASFSQLVAKDNSRFVGATVDLSSFEGVRQDALLFGETQNRVVITTTPANAGRVAKQARLLGVPATVIGKVGGSSLSIKTSQGQIEAEVGILHSAWWNSIAIAMNQPASSSDQ
ncbi:MAG TPA: phosphoribosylformylglycinamidine synthase subunit PurL [Candidatus Limnocylindria bacterium]|nr:phosphoribosylformylglycinamidine synthase subunit PurL [Candidatus Limnocylindria bacterium]